MKWHVLILSMVATVVLTASAGTFTDNVWTNIGTTNVWVTGGVTNGAGVYTNLIGREFCTNVFLRARWAGDTNYWFTNSVDVSYDKTMTNWSITYTNPPASTNIYTRPYTNWNYTTTNITVTNCFGDIFIQDVYGHSVTGMIPFHAEGAERLTGELVALMPLYVLPYYQYGTSNYDLWFSHPIATNISGVDYAQTNLDGTTNYIDRFPLGDTAKADLFQKYGLGTNTWMSNDVVMLGYQTNAYGEVTNTAGWFSKRKNCIDPLLVAEWRRYNSVTSIGGTEVTNDWEYYRGWSNEFTSGDSQLFGITNTQYPVFIIHLGGTNQYTPGSLHLEQATDEDGFGVLWYWYDHDGLISEWTSNKCFSTNNDLSYVEDIILNSTTQRSDRAWLALGAPLKLTGTPPNTYYRTNIVSGVTNITPSSSDVVSLQYTNKMNTYEGNKVWDIILLPEQLTEHYTAMTNMYLVEWKAEHLFWTNSILTTNQLVTNGLGLLKTNMFTTYDLLGDFQTNSVASNTFCSAIDPDDNPIHEATPWWLTNNPAPWFYVQMPSFIPAVSPDSNLTARVAPYFNYGYSVTAIVEQVFDGYTYYGITNVVPQTNWTWSAIRTGAVSHLEVLGESVRSQLFITDLYTGTPHCAHIYVKYNFDTATNAVPYWHWLLSTDFTTASNIMTPHIDLSTNILGQLLQPVTNRTGLDCADWMLGSWSNVFVDWKTVPLNITTNYASGWVSTGVSNLVGGAFYTNEVWDSIESNVLMRFVWGWTNFISCTAAWSEVTFSTNDFTWQLYTKRHFHDELIGGVLTPVPDSPLRTNHTWVSDCDIIATNITSLTTNYPFSDYALADFTYVENGTNVHEIDSVRVVEVQLVCTNFDRGCVDVPNPFCEWSSDFIDWYAWPNWNALVGEFDSAWDVIHRHPNESMYSPYTELYAMLYCETPLTGLYNFSTAHEHDWDKLETNVNLLNTVGVKVLIEWLK